jgi:hypothetical protein
MRSRRAELIKYYAVKNNGAHKILYGHWSRRVELIKYYVVKKREAHKILCGQEERSS